MKFRTLLVPTLSVALSLGSPAFAQPHGDADDRAAALADAWFEDASARFEARAGVLARHEDTDSLVLAMVLGRWTDESGGWSAQQQAWCAQLWQRPATPLSAWMLRMRCSQDDRDRALPLLAEVGQDDAWAQLALGAAALAAGDTTEAAARLDQASRASLPNYPGRVSGLVYREIDRIELPELDAATAEAVRADLGWQPSTTPLGTQTLRLLMALQVGFGAFPAMNSGELRTLCDADGEFARAPAQRQACMALLDRMAREDASLMNRLIGSTFALSLAEGADRPAAAELYRQVQWQWVLLRDNQAWLDAHPDKAEHGLRALLEHGEMAGQAWIAEMRGASLQAPPDWLPEDERSRQRILDARSPG